MPVAALNRNHTFVEGLHSFGNAAAGAWNTAAQKIKDMATSPVGQGIIGGVLGMGMPFICSPLTARIINALGVSTIAGLPYSNLSLGVKILLSPVICISSPINEEWLFRGGLQEMLNEAFQPFYTKLGFSDHAAMIASRVTSIFFASLVFGLVHFTNAFFFGCSPMVFLPQVVAATLLGIIFGLAKECTGGLAMPIGMHIGNNTLAWALSIYSSWNAN